ncbi:MAG: phosphodiesterase YaeI [Bryobacterales bacterium]|nr:phosphodiesterase YaeI [Bryobacterales bacterium]
MQVSRRTFLRAGGGIVGAGFATGSYAFGVEPNWFDLTQSTIPTRWLPAGKSIRILHLSDLHASTVIPFERLTTAIRMGLSMQPDLICLTGDYITTDTECDLQRYRDVLAEIPKAAPTFACVGNHDGGRWSELRSGFKTSERIRQLLADAGIHVLQNQSAESEINGVRLHLVGLADFWTREFDSRAAFDGLPKQSEQLRIVLSHNPDTKAILQYYSWELLLCGHTHGGQVKIPFIGPPILPILDRQFYEGLHTWQGRRIYITRGVGGVYGGIRFDCRPEVTILNLVPGDSPVELTESRPRVRA